MFDFATTDLSLAIAHHLLIFVLAGVLAFEIGVIRPSMKREDVLRVASVDNWHGILAVAPQARAAAHFHQFGRFRAAQDLPGLLAWHIILVLAQPRRKRDPDSPMGEADALRSLFALSASCAIFLILELSKPFSGLMMISSEPLRHALAPL